MYLYVLLPAAESRDGLAFGLVHWKPTVALRTMYVGTDWRMETNTELGLLYVLEEVWAEETKSSCLSFGGASCAL
jgi:hypothetical protein